MSVRLVRRASLAGVLAAVLGGCGGDAREAPARAQEPAGAEAQVYTSEVESVSRWIKEGRAEGATGELVARKNPRGEGVIVYSRDPGSPTGETAAWVVVDSQVVALNESARRANPRPPASEGEARARERAGLAGPGGEQRVQEILRADTAAARPQAETKTEAEAAAPPPPTPEPQLLGRPVRDTAAAPRPRTDPVPSPRPALKPAAPPPDTTGAAPLVLPSPDSLP